MRQVVIENPILNSPFAEPTRHFRFSDEGITDEVVEARRVSSYFVPIARPKKLGPKQRLFETEWTQDRIEENKFINQVRARVALWREGNRPGVTRTTADLLAYWTNPDRDKKLFFCQIEALETAIYLTEAAKKYGDAWIENKLADFNQAANPMLSRIAFKMATGSGKTVVMAMLIAWQALNKLADPRDARFADAFLIVTPGITIRDRLRVLLPNDPDNYYRQRDVLPAYLLEELGRAKIIITNYHTFQLREQVKAGKLTKDILADGRANPFLETPDQMVRRVCRELGAKKNVIVINDEAHHCYRRRPADDEPKLTGEDRTEAEKRNKSAHIWLSGLEAVEAKRGIRAIYDLSATPFFLRGSGYNEGTLFPWVVSDFSLIDAIESGIVKVPRVPVADDSLRGEQPTYRDLWLRIRDALPRKGRKTEAVTGEPRLPAELQGALHSLYGNYEKAYRAWEQNAEAQARGLTPPVFIVVCNNTNVSKLVFDYVAGWEKPVDDGAVVQAGAFDIFRNDDGRGGWLHRPNTILIDSEQLESGEAMSTEFKHFAAVEIEEFKAEYRARFPGRDADGLTDEDLLREVMNTVGKPGKLGEHIKCVVSVSMLTEGWDANTVTHILGVRAFGTQLLCEQVVGRGLRRMSYSVNDDGRLDPEYAEVYGVPFSFIPCSGATKEPKPGPMPTRVRALEERIGCEITFPRVLGYRYDIADAPLGFQFSADTRMSLSTADIPTMTENRPIVGETSIHRLDDLKARREQQVAFLLAKLTLEKYFRTVKPGSGAGDFVIGGTQSSNGSAEVQMWRFPEVLAIARRWLAECVTCKDNAFPQLLLLIEFAHNAADKIYLSIVGGTSGEQTKRLMPILQPYDTLGSTRFVDFDTTRRTWPTAAEKCHVSHVVADTESWEQKMAQTLEEMPDVVHYVKNQGLAFTIPYTIDGEERRYVPDFIAHVDVGCSASTDGRDNSVRRVRSAHENEDRCSQSTVRAGRGEGAYLNLIVEVTGQRKADKAAKVATARNLWVPAVNNDGSFGRWAFVEISDPWDATTTIRGSLDAELGAGSANT